MTVWENSFRYFRFGIFSPTLWPSGDCVWLLSGRSPVQHPTSGETCMWGKQLAAMAAIYTSKGVRQEVNLGNIYHVCLCQVWIRLPTLALKPRGDVTSPKQGYQWPQKWTRLPKIKKIINGRQIFQTLKNNKKCQIQILVFNMKCYTSLEDHQAKSEFLHNPPRLTDSLTIPFGLRFGCPAWSVDHSDVGIRGNGGLT